MFDHDWAYYCIYLIIYVYIWIFIYLLYTGKIVYTNVIFLFVEDQYDYCYFSLFLVYVWCISFTYFRYIIDMSVPVQIALNVLVLVISSNVEPDQSLDGDHVGNCPDGLEEAVWSNRDFKPGIPIANWLKIVKMVAIQWKHDHSLDCTGLLVWIQCRNWMHHSVNKDQQNFHI